MNEKIEPESEIESESETESLSSTLDDIASTLADEMPDVQQHAIEQHIENESKIRAEWDEYTDVDGNKFDANIHKTNKNGEPTLSTKGNLIKKPGRKGKSQAGSNTSSFVARDKEKSTPSPEEKATQMSRASGAMAANLLITVGVVVGGEEWYPQKNEQLGVDEKTMLESAFADYFVATGRTDIPPGLALTAAIGGYIIPRFALPKTKSRASKFVAWIKQKWLNRKLKKHGLKTEKLDNKET